MLVLLRIIHSDAVIYGNITNTKTFPLRTKHMETKKLFKIFLTTQQTYEHKYCKHLVISTNINYSLKMVLKGRHM
jgi:hypothetical protein